MRRNWNVVPRQIKSESNKKDTLKLSGGDAERLQQLFTDCVQNNLVKPKRQPVLQLQVAKRRNHRAKFATLGLSKALRVAAVHRSLKYIIPVQFSRRITLDIIEKRPIVNRRGL